MKMTRAVPPFLPSLGLLIVATFLAAAVVALLPVSEAQAESGRRICEYSLKAKPRNNDDPLMRISLGLDYKKDGKCPDVAKELLVGTGYVDADQVFPNPVEKWTCEDWGTTHNLYYSELGADPCPQMIDDHVYAFFWMDPTLPNADKPYTQDLGHWTRYD